MQPVLEMPKVWTFELLHDALEAMPAGVDVDWRRYEIVDGALVVSPSTFPLHEFVIAQLQAALRPMCPHDVVVLGSLGVDLGRSYRVPDVVVIAVSTVRANKRLLRPAEVLLAVEVVSPGSVTTDRITKPAQYAAAGIGHFWRVETEPEVLLAAYALEGDRYREVGTWRAGEVAGLTAPFPVEIVIDDLVPPAEAPPPAP